MIEELEKWNTERQTSIENLLLPLKLALRDCAKALSNFSSLLLLYSEFPHTENLSKLNEEKENLESKFSLTKTLIENLTVEKRKMLKNYDIIKPSRVNQALQFMSRLFADRDQIRTQLVNTGKQCTSCVE